VTIPLGAAIGAGSGAATAIITGGDVSTGFWVGGLTGTLVGATLGAGTTFAAGWLGAGEFGASFAGSIATGYGSGVVGSALPTAVEYGVASYGVGSSLPQAVANGVGGVDWGVANNNGLVGAGVAVLPALVSASAASATAVGGGALYSAYQQSAIASTVGFYDVAAGSATSLLFSDYLTQPTPYTGPPASFNPTFSFPSSDPYRPTYDAYCTPKCF
jgi:hypothetical protein